MPREFLKEFDLGAHLFLKLFPPMASGTTISPESPPPLLAFSYFSHGFLFLFTPKSTTDNTFRMIPSALEIKNIQNKIHILSQSILHPLLSSSVIFQPETQVHPGLLSPA